MRGNGPFCGRWSCVDVHVFARTLNWFTKRLKWNNDWSRRQNVLVDKILWLRLILINKWWGLRLAKLSEDCEKYERERERVRERESCVYLSTSMDLSFSIVYRKLVCVYQIIYTVLGMQREREREREREKKKSLYKKKRDFFVWTCEYVL